MTGFARTGTTLMQGLLCASPDVMPVSAEAVILRDLVVGYARSRELWRDYSRHYFADLPALRAYHRALVASWLVHVRTRFATEKRLLQKLPQFAAAYLPGLARLLPNARFVVMLRDPRDVMASQNDRHVKRKRPFDAEKEIQEFVRIYSKLARARTLAGRLAIVPYERLVREPDGTIRTVSEFLGVAPPANVRSLEWAYLRDPGVTTSSPLDGRPVTAERVARYRATPPSPVLALVERRHDEIEQKIGLKVFDDASAPAPITLL